MNAVHCGASVSGLVLHWQHNSFAQYNAVYNLCSVYMHNKEKLRFMHEAVARLERPALSPSLLFVSLSCLYALLSLPHVEPVLSIVVACFPYLAMVHVALLEVFRISSQQLSTEEF